MTFIFLNVCLIVVSEISNVSCNATREGMWIGALAPVVITNSMATFHPSLCILFIKGIYLLVLKVL